MKIDEYFKACNGHFIAIDQNQEKILILDINQVVVKELYPSASVQNLDLTFESIFKDYTNVNGLTSQLSVMTSGHDGKDWLFLSPHVLSL
ncbi:hypothetical protein LV84_00005 [Algoriphagus ratkowskyi]|uniref:Uncharacterized protein n=1 Tax=Algoriphagus ratkowskyi TaxID=57028 RepID=A0A2W7S0S4_9BACT|nr:hypothetical protein [Algoriphagus ratkowskyi]PZX61017.1 hypothetical protein LV84_00005 [Algoriphagus ratkowskyi]TXD79154.1 hypothetical protein ESW18_02645 [Algoriphagus ratkowskyi]